MKRCMNPSDIVKAVKLHVPKGWSVKMGTGSVRGTVSVHPPYPSDHLDECRVARKLRALFPRVDFGHSLKAEPFCHYWLDMTPSQRLADDAKREAARKAARPLHMVDVPQHIVDRALGIKRNPKVRSIKEQQILLHRAMERQERHASQHSYKSRARPGTPEWDPYFAESQRLSKKTHATRLRLAGLNQKAGHGMAETTAMVRAAGHPYRSFLDNPSIPIVSSKTLKPVKHISGWHTYRLVQKLRGKVDRSMTFFAPSNEAARAYVPKVTYDTGVPIKLERAVAARQNPSVTRQYPIPDAAIFALAHSMKAKTQRNDHMDAHLDLAKLLASPLFIEQARQFKDRRDKRGYVDHDDSKAEYALYKRMMAQLKRRASPRGYELIHRSL